MQHLTEERIITLHDVTCRYPNITSSIPETFICSEGVIAICSGVRIVNSDCVVPKIKVFDSKRRSELNTFTFLTSPTNKIVHVVNHSASDYIDPLIRSLATPVRTEKMLFSFLR